MSGMYWHAVLFSCASSTLKSKKCQIVIPEMLELAIATSTSRVTISVWYLSVHFASVVFASHS